MNTKKKTIQVSVRTLVEFVCRSGDLGGGEFVSSNRAVEGTRAHRKIQKSRPEEYTAEVSLVHSFETELFILEISGRIDGIYHYPDRIVIEEIKSTRHNPDAFGYDAKHPHWAQLKLYAYFYAVEHELEAIDTQLVYYQLETEKTREIPQHFSKDELEIFFQDLLAKYIEWANTLEIWRQQRDDSIRNLDFPFSAYRPGQREMAVDVFVSIREQSQLLVQAPTGIGKTMATLFPAMKAIAEGHTEKIFYLTARTTGRVTAEKTLDELRRKG